MLNNALKLNGDAIREIVNFYDAFSVVFSVIRFIDHALPA
jgi:hypothetical protein